jgi:uncharacterized protein YoxC
VLFGVSAVALIFLTILLVVTIKKAAPDAQKTNA